MPIKHNSRQSEQLYNTEQDIKSSLYPYNPMKFLRNCNMDWSCKFLNIQGQRDFLLFAYYHQIVISFQLSVGNERKKKHDRQGKLSYLSKQMTWKQPTYRTGNIKACPNLNFQNRIA